jgi:hypothetical protein
VTKQRTELAKAAANDVTGLQIPEWVPPSIHEPALRFYHRALGAFEGKPAAMIKRLAVDERMAPVWDKLRREGGEAFFAELFGAIVSRMQIPFLLQPGHAGQATKLRDHARAVKKQRPEKTFGRHAGKLIRAAKSYDALDAAGLPREEIMRAVCNLADLLTERFGAPHYQEVAAIASVALDRPISADDVRNWVRAVKMVTKD